MHQLLLDRLSLFVVFRVLADHGQCLADDLVLLVLILRDARISDIRWALRESFLLFLACLVNLAAQLTHFDLRVEFLVDESKF